MSRRNLLHIQVPNVEEAHILLEFTPDRIGHGTCLHPDSGGSQVLLDVVETHSIPIGMTGGYHNMFCSC